MSECQHKNIKYLMDFKEHKGRYDYYHTPKGIIMRCKDCEKELGFKYFENLITKNPNVERDMKAVYEVMR